MGVVVLFSLDLCALGVIGLLAQKTAARGPVADGHLGIIGVLLLVEHFIGLAIAEAIRCNRQQPLTLQQGAFIGELNIDRVPCVGVYGEVVEEIEGLFCCVANGGLGRALPFGPGVGELLLRFVGRVPHQATPIGFGLDFKRDRAGVVVGL